MKCALFAKDMAHGITDFSQCSICLNSSDDQWHQIFGSGRTMLQSGQGLLQALVVSALA
jgi:hypothetical protein